MDSDQGQPPETRAHHRRQSTRLIELVDIDFDLANAGDAGEIEAEQAVDVVDVIDTPTENTIEEKIDQEEVIEEEKEEKIDTVMAALSFVEYAHKKNANYTGKVFITLTDATGMTENLEKTVIVTPESAIVTDGKGDGLDCSVVMDREVLISMVAGITSPTMALMFGQVIVDDVNELQKFSSSFAFSRAKFEEFKATIAEEQATEAGEEHLPVPTYVDRSKVKVAMASGGVRFITGVATLSRKIDRQMEKVRGTSRYQQLSVKMASTGQRILETDTMKRLRQNPKVQKSVEIMSKTIASAKGAARGMYSSMQVTAQYHPPPVDRYVGMSLNERVEAMREAQAELASKPSFSDAYMEL